MSENNDWNDGGEVIDLTNSFTYVDHCALGNVVIEIDTDDSYIDGHTTIQDVNDSCAESVTNHLGDEQGPITVRSPRKRAKGKKSLSSKKENQDLLPQKRFKKNKTSQGFGECPICCDELGNNPMASTNCGHVFCLKCLQRSIRIQKKCPTCRKVLNGRTGYHPLYL